MKNNKKLKAGIIALVVVIIIMSLIYFRPAPDYARNPILEMKMIIQELQRYIIRIT